MSGVAIQSVSDTCQHTQIKIHRNLYSYPFLRLEGYTNPSTGAPNLYEFGILQTTHWVRTNTTIWLRYWQFQQPMA